MENARDMDEALKYAICRFFKKEYEGKSGYAVDFVDELEQYLKEEGFDLGCVVQYKTK